MAGKAIALPKAASKGSLFVNAKRVAGTKSAGPFVKAIPASAELARLIHEPKKATSHATPASKARVQVVDPDGVFTAFEIEWAVSYTIMKYTHPMLKAPINWPQSIAIGATLVANAHKVPTTVTYKLASVRAGTGRPPAFDVEYAVQALFNAVPPPQGHPPRRPVRMTAFTFTVRATGKSIGRV